MKKEGLISLLLIFMLLTACGSGENPRDDTIDTVDEETQGRALFMEAQQGREDLLSLLETITLMEDGLEPSALAVFAKTIEKDQIGYFQGRRPDYFSAVLCRLDTGVQLTLYSRSAPGVFIADCVYMQGGKIISTDRRVTEQEAGVLLEQGKRLIYVRQQQATCPFDVETCSHTYHLSQLVAMDLDSGMMVELLPARVYLELAVTRLGEEAAQVEAIWYPGLQTVSILTGTVDDRLIFTQTEYREEAAEAADYHHGLLIAEESISWAKLGGVIVSLTVDGTEQLEGYKNRHSDVENRIAAFTMATDLRQGWVFPLGNSFSGAAPDYTGVLAQPEVEIYGDWAPFPAAVVWRSYTVENQPSLPEYTDYISERLAVSIPDAPILITDLYYTDLDRDGEDEVIVCASNYYMTDNGELPMSAIQPNLPEGERTGCYALTILFSPSLGVVELYSRIMPVSLGKDGDSTSFARLPDYTEYYNDYSSYQLDENGSVIISPVFHTENNRPEAVPVPVIFDCDGDGKAELMLVGRWAYFSCPVYKVENGTLAHSHSVIFPA